MQRLINPPCPHPIKYTPDLYLAKTQPYHDFHTQTLKNYPQPPFTARLPAFLKLSIRTEITIFSYTDNGSIVSDREIRRQRVPADQRNAKSEWSRKTRTEYKPSDQCQVLIQILFNADRWDLTI